MNINEQLLSILQAFLSETDFTCEVNDFDTLIALAGEHSLRGIISYTMLKHNTSLEPDCNSLRKTVYSVMQTHCEQQYCFEQICKSLETAGIDFIPIKGIRLCHLYPVPDLREMGDIDILIHEEDRDKANECMIQAGFLLVEKRADDSLYQSGGVQVEIHCRLFEKLVEIHSSTEDYLSDGLWEHVVSTELLHCFHLDVETEFILHLLHMASHFYSSSCGIRFFLDIAFYLKQYGDSLDFSRITKTLKTFGLSEFGQYTSSISAQLFNVKEVPSISALDTETTEELLQFVLQGGTFGKTFYYTHPYYREGKERVLKENSKRASSISIILKKIFTTREHWAVKAPYLRKKPWLFPIAIFQRCRNIYRLYRSPKVSLDGASPTPGFSALTSVTPSLELGEKYGELLKKIGL